MIARVIFCKKAKDMSESSDLLLLMFDNYNIIPFNPPLGHEERIISRNSITTEDGLVNGSSSASKIIIKKSFAGV